MGGAVVGFFVHVGARVGPYVGGAGADVGSYWARAAASSHKKYIFMAALLSSRMAAHFFGVRPSEISGGNKRSASRLTRGNCGVAPADKPSGTSLPVNLGRLVCASNLLAGRARTAAPRAYVSSRLMPRRVLLSCSAWAACVPRARLWDLAICLQYFSDGSTLHQRLLGAVCCSQFEHRGSGEALGLDILSAWFCAWIRHDRPTAAKHISYEHRLSDAHAIQSLSPSKRTLLHANKANTWLPP